MKLEKAIELLQRSMPPYTLENDPDTYNAIKLGIEALKRFVHYRRDTVNSILDLLPGETKD